MGGDGSEPIESGRDCWGVGLAVLIRALCGMAGDCGCIGIIVQPVEREGGMQEITHKPLSCGPVVRFGRLTPEDGESGMLPAEQKIDDPGGDDLLGQQCLKELVTEEPHHLFCVGPENGLEAAVAGEAAVRRQTVQMGVK